jgi:hypothetical protein
MARPCQRGREQLRSKWLIDKVDDQLARIYALTPQQADFIKSYDIKYRLAGTDENQTEGEE